MLAACCLMRYDTIFIIIFHLMHTYLPYITWLWLHHHIRRRWHEGLARGGARFVFCFISFTNSSAVFFLGSLRIDTHIFIYYFVWNSFSGFHFGHRKSCEQPAARTKTKSEVYINSTLICIKHLLGKGFDKSNCSLIAARRERLTTSSLSLSLDLPLSHLHKEFIDYDFTE